MVEITMGLNIKNPALEADIRALADMTGESLTDAVATAVRERQARLGKPKLTDEQRRALIGELQDSLRDFPEEFRTSDLSDLYDENGLPR